MSVSPDIRPMEALAAADLPDGPGWHFEPKWDGFRCLVHRDGASIRLMSRSGKPLGRYFPELVDLVEGLECDNFVLDGEIILPLGDALDFDALQMRLHPAESRVLKLARESPAQIMLFDLLAVEGESWADRPLTERRRRLERFHQASARPGLGLSPASDDRRVAERWLERSGGALDGVIAKRSDQPYRPGERAMIKVKPHRTADCVVGGFRYASKGRSVGSLLLGLYDDEGLLHHVGYTSAISASEREQLTRDLEALVEPPGFTGNAPGGPSRWTSGRSAEWSPLKPRLVVEVRYDQVTARRFRHGTKLLRWRPDKPADECRFDQLVPPLRPSQLDQIFRR